MLSKFMIKFTIILSISEYLNNKLNRLQLLGFLFYKILKYSYS